MSEQQNHNKRIAKNTIMLYIRMFFSMCVAFYTSRVILDVLGVVDYGISNIVGGVASMFTFLNGSLSGATSRFLTVSLAEGDESKMRKTFSATWTIHLILAVLVFILCETIGLWILENKLVLPDNSRYAVHVLYQLSVVTTMISIAQVPFSSILIAHERMGFYAYLGIADVVLKLGAVCLLQWLPFNKLILYGVLYFIIRTGIMFVNAWYAKKQFTECNVLICHDKRVLFPIFNFSGWDLFGCMSIMARTQGIDILQNLFLGPIINAASGISGLVMNVITGFSSNFIMAVRPRITKLYAQSEFIELQKLTEKSARLALFLLFFISLPAFLELPAIMNVWLTTVPDYAVSFVRLSIIFNLTIILFFPLSAVIHATGRMKRISLINGSLYLTVLPITYLAYKLTDVSPMLPYIVNTVLGFLGGLANLKTVKLYIPEFNVKKYMFKAVLRGFITIATATILPAIVYKCLPNNFSSFVIVCLLCVFSSVLAIAVIGLEKNERLSIFNIIMSKLQFRRQVIANA